MKETVTMCSRCGKRPARGKAGLCKYCYDLKWKNDHYVSQKKFFDRRTEQTMEILKAIENGERKAEIAKRFGISRQRVYQILANSKEREKKS